MIPPSGPPNKPALLVLRYALLLASLAVFALVVVTVAQLNRTYHPGFEVLEHRRLVVAESRAFPLETGDTVLSINNMPIHSEEDWRHALKHIPPGSTVELEIPRDGDVYQLRVVFSNLQACRLEFEPQSVLLLVKQAPAELPLRQGDRVLSVNGIPVKPGNVAKVTGLLNSRDESMIRIVFSRRGRTDLVITSGKSAGRIVLDTFETFPVIISRVHPVYQDRLRPGMQIMAVNNRPVWNERTFGLMMESFKAGQPLQINYREGTDFGVVQYPLQLTLWSTHTAGNIFRLSCLLFGFLFSVFLLIKLPEQTLGLSQSSLYICLACMLTADWIQMWNLPSPLVALALPGIALLPAAAWSLLTIFPVPWTGHLPRRVQTFPAFLLAGWTCGTIILAWDRWPLALPLQKGAFILFTLTGLAASIFFLRKTQEPYTRHAFRIIYIFLTTGLLFTATGFLAGILSPDLRFSWYVSLPTACYLGVPLSLLYHYIRKRVIYTDAIFKQSVSYTIVSATILFLYFLVVVWLGSLLHRLFKIEDVWILLIFLIFAAFVVEPLKSKVIRLIDRFFYRTQANYQDYVLESSRQFNYPMEIPEIIDLTMNRVCEVFYISGGYLALRTGDEPFYHHKAWRNSEVSDCRELPVPAQWQIAAWLLESRSPIELRDRKHISRFQELPAEERDLLTCLKVTLLAPLISRGELLGILLLKRKLSGELYSSEDLHFLGIICNQAAIALHNAIIRESEKSVLRSLYQQKRLALLGQVSANIAHEIRNPLVAIKGLGKLVEDSLAPDDRRKQHMKVLNDEVARLQRVVSDLVRYARPSSLQKSPVSLDRLTREVLELYQDEIKKHQATLVFHEPAVSVELDADAEKIKQVVINLLQNALEATPADGQITIEVGLRSTGDFPDLYSTHAFFRIQDSGPGILPENSEKIFEPFFTSKRDGTGLGLAIAREIVEAHGGKIEYAGPANDGACFEFRIPLEQSPAGALV